MEEEEVMETAGGGGVEMNTAKEESGESEAEKGNGVN